MKHQTLSVATMALILCGGCVRRTVSFDSEPSGARVFLNDREIGRTPATVDFTWYGDYDVVYRLEDHDTLKTHVRLSPPLYQIFPFDLLAEVLWPGHLHDQHDAPLAQMTPTAPADPVGLIDRARTLRDDALFKGSLTEPAPPTTP